MKYRMVKKACTVLLLLLSSFHCSSPEVLDVVDDKNSTTKGSKKGNPDLLRLTYDLAFRPPPGYILEEKASLHDKGNLYRIRFPIELNGFSYLKISSTNSENSGLFEYEVSRRELENAKWKKYYYLPVQDKPNPATLILVSCGEGFVCVRWEWTYSGFLIVFESKGKFSEKETEPKKISENYHQIIEKHLLVY